MELREITTGLHFPEGPIALADGSFLVVEIERGTLTRVAADGHREVVATPGGGPNGAAIGPDGKCYLCNSGIMVISPDGARVEHIPMPDSYTTNICFGGPELRTAFITLSMSGRLVATEWPRPGLALQYLNR
jgi:sugar lactone lactonase YvrE